MKGIMRSVKKSDLEKISIRNCEELMKECKYQTKLVSSDLVSFVMCWVKQGVMSKEKGVFYSKVEGQLTTTLPARRRMEPIGYLYM